MELKFEAARFSKTKKKYMAYDRDYAPLFEYQASISQWKTRETKKQQQQQL